MQSFGLLALVSAAIFTNASALVDASVRTIVTQSANAYDPRPASDGGCDPAGCSADLTRDLDRTDGSRWSCSEDLEDEQCKITYEFDEPQDIVRLYVQFHKGDERVRSLELRGSGGYQETITSSGTSQGYERFDIGTDETAWLSMEAQGLDGDEWISITEVRFMVE